jgi:hypothetical protein
MCSQSCYYESEGSLLFLRFGVLSDFAIRIEQERVVSPPLSISQFFSEVPKSL